MAENDIKTIVFDRIRHTLASMKMAASNAEISSIITNTRHLLINIRKSSALNSSNSIPIIPLFLSILKSANIPKYQKIVALTSLDTFLVNNIFAYGNSSTPIEKNNDILHDIVETILFSISQYEDDIYRIHCYNILGVLISHHASSLSDSTLWDIINQLFKSLVKYKLLIYFNSNNNNGYNTASSSNSMDSNHIMYNAAENLLQQIIKSVLCASEHVPCVMKLFSYLIQILKKFIDNAQVRIVNKKLNPLARSNSISNGVNALGNGIETEIMETYLALKVLKFCLLTTENSIIYSYKPILSMIRDDLCNTMILLITIHNEYTSFVFQSLVELFCVIVCKLGPIMRVVIECFMQYVYIKGLHQLLGLLKGSDDSSDTMYSSMELEVIFDSLGDLVSDNTYITTLFISFDCDPQRPDILQPLLYYLSRCARHFLYISNENSPSSGHIDIALEEHALQVNNIFQLLLRSIADRCGSVNTTVRSSSIDVIVKTYEAKKLLREASQQFIKKPEHGLKFLQERGALPTPLTPSSVAKYLRIAPSLPKENVGAYLGELGKDNAAFEGDSVAFHREVLLEYVKSFHLRDQNILNCLRIFLSAFRLPGEAQQIDRILGAFSEYCFSNCKEGSSGSVENPEVVYLLTFSIIMLNTDRHNPNVRLDRKMTLEQFIRNNTNFGKDVKQTIPLTKEYLEEIYTSISQYPIRTEKNDATGIITLESLLDLSLQVEDATHKGLLSMISYNPSLIQKLKVLYDINDVSTSTSEVPSIIHSYLTSDDYSPYNIYQFSTEYYNDSTVLAAMDEHVINTCWQELIAVGISPLLTNKTASSNTSTSPRNTTSNSASNSNNTLDNAELVLTDNLVLFDSVDIQKTRIGVDVLITVIKVLFNYNKVEYIDLLIILLCEIAGVVKGNKTLQYLNKKLSLELDSISTNQAGGSSSNHLLFISNLCYSLPARASLGTILQILHNNSNYITHIHTWSIMWRMLALLRDCTILPLSLVTDNNSISGSVAASNAEDSNLIPKAAVVTFETRLQAYLQTNNTGRKPHTPSSLRWDSGYENYHAEAKSTNALESSIASLRELVTSCGITSFIADSRWLHETILVNKFIQSLIEITHASDISLPHKRNGDDAKGKEEPAVATAPESIIDEIYTGLQGQLPVISPASCAWFELILYEITIRNRDRFHLIWPVLEKHYTKCISNCYILSYPLERRVISIFKIAIRMLSRDAVISRSIISLIGGLFTLPKTYNSETSVTSSSTDPLAPDVLLDLTDHIASCMWPLITLNVSTLPSLFLEQWQLLFDVLSVCSSVGGYAAIKSFQSMAWLLHEPRLTAEVPLSIVVGLKPLLCNNHVPMTVSIGTVKLLISLHHRLEVIANSTIDAGAADGSLVSDQLIDEEGPVALWQICWVPILNALANGASDERYGVRKASVRALALCINDRHIHAVPPGVIVNILGDIIVPTLLLLGESFVAHIGNDNQLTKSVDNWEHATHDHQVVTELATKDLSNILTTITDDSHTLFGDLVCEIINSITKAFIEQLPKLAAYPSFDKLWLRLLNVCGFFLGASHGLNHDMLHKINNKTSIKQLNSVTEAFKTNLELMLNTLISTQVFKTRSGLWIITIESITSFSQFPNFLQTKPQPPHKN